jgi:hypothetical protein
MNLLKRHCIGGISSRVFESSPSHRGGIVRFPQSLRRLERISRQLFDHNPANYLISDDRPSGAV